MFFFVYIFFSPLCVIGRRICGPWRLNRLACTSTNDSDVETAPTRPQRYALLGLKEAFLTNYDTIHNHSHLKTMAMVFNKLILDIMHCRSQSWDDSLNAENAESRAGQTGVATRITRWDKCFSLKHLSELSHFFLNLFRGPSSAKCDARRFAMKIYTVKCRIPVQKCISLFILFFLSRRCIFYMLIKF